MLTQFNRGLNYIFLQPCDVLYLQGNTMDKKSLRSYLNMTEGYEFEDSQGSEKVLGCCSVFIEQSFDDLIVY